MAKANTKVLLMGTHRIRRSLARPATHNSTIAMVIMRRRITLITDANRRWRCWVWRCARWVSIAQQGGRGGVVDEGATATAAPPKPRRGQRMAKLGKCDLARGARGGCVNGGRHIVAAVVETAALALALRSVDVGRCDLAGGVEMLTKAQPRPRRSQSRRGSAKACC